ncbi:hypothetical protein ISP17_09885 [Dyella ginsengisoli]|uniref:Lipoprotein n=1 Tax=Dyella ginsengisoli TaxID=363848 RepID=A0ABW8JT19_9GAMM
MKARWVLSTALLALCGCTAVDQLAGMGVVSQSVSTSDHATIIEVSPNALYDPGNERGTPLQLGARWTSDSPQSVALVLSYQSTVSSDAPTVQSFEALQISIDGQASSFPASKPSDISSSFHNPVSHTIYTSSRGEVLIPYALLQQMVAAKDCWLRATGGGYQDARFSTEHLPSGKATAIVSIRAFIAKVDAASASEAPQRAR